MPQPSQAHLARVSSLSGPALASGIRPVITGPAPEGRRTAARVFPLPFGRRHSLPGHPFPPGIPPLLRSAYRQAAGCRPRTMTGFPRSAHMRYGRIGRPLYPGTSGAPTGHSRSWPAACRLSPARVLHPSGTVIYPGPRDNEASSRVHLRSPARPSPRPQPRMTREPLGLLPRASHPREQDPRTHAGAGTGSEH